APHAVRHAALRQPDLSTGQPPSIPGRVPISRFPTLASLVRRLLDLFQSGFMVIPDRRCPFTQRLSRTFISWIISAWRFDRALGQSIVHGCDVEQRVPHGAAGDLLGFGPYLIGTIAPVRWVRKWSPPWVASHALALPQFNQQSIGQPVHGEEQQPFGNGRLVI